MVVVTDPAVRRRHIHGHPLHVMFSPHPRAIESDISIRRDIARLLEDVRRAKHGEPPLAGVGAVIGGVVAAVAVAGIGAVAGATLVGKTSFELGAYVAEALMAHGIVAQMPDVPKVSAITPTMTEEAGRAAFVALGKSDSSDGPFADRINSDDFKTSGIKFWAEPGTDKKIAAEIKARKKS
jgi:hypothetical protein